MNNQKIWRCAVMGNPIAHSRSPFLHQYFAQQANLNLCYERQLVRLDGFKEAVTYFFDNQGDGLNVTLPFKQQAYELAYQHLTNRAKIAGSVNTLWYEQGQLHGDNTDGIGLVTDLKRQGQEIRGQSIALIGAGGAARGAIPALIEAGCKHIQIANRTISKAQTLLDELKTLLPYHTHQISICAISDLAPADIIINATSSSLSNSTLPLPSQYFSQAQFAYDMLYTQEGSTSFLKQANYQGCPKQSDGLGMLVFQGLESFARWTGQRPIIYYDDLSKQLRNAS